MECMDLPFGGLDPESLPRRSGALHSVPFSSRVPPPWHCGHSGPYDYSAWGADLCSVGCLEASLAPIL